MGPESSTGHAVSGETGWGRVRLRLGASRLVPNFSRPRRQGPITTDMNRQARAGLMLRPKWLRCRRTDARNAAVGSCAAGEPNWPGTPAPLWGQQVACGWPEGRPKETHLRV